MRTILLSLLIFISTGASAAPMLTTNAGGEVTGATGLEYLGQTFSMEFVDGSCASLFDGCDEDSDFLVTSAVTHADLLEVFYEEFVSPNLTLDDGSLDAQPDLALGCSDVDICYSFAPSLLFVGTSTTVLPSSVNNFSFNSGGFDIYEPFFPIDFPIVAFDTTDNSFINWARFSLQATNVPEPGLLALLALGLAGLGLSRKRKIA